jgi:hypothetical protein
MTPYEFDIAVEGYYMKTRIEWRKVALILNTMGKSLKQNITVDELLGIKKPQGRIDKEEKKNTLNELKNKFGG